MAPVFSRSPAGAFSGATAPGAQAAALAFAPIAYGEAPRIGVVGDTRVGKTHLVNQYVAEYTARSLGIVAVIDDKLPDRAQYAGQVYGSPVDLNSRAPEPDPHVLVFRGVDGQCDPEEIAAYCWALRERRRPSLLVLDELNHPLLTNNGMWARGASWVPKTFWQGGGANIGCIWNAQSPQDAPRAAFEQSSNIVCFKLAGLGLRKLRELDYCDAAVAAVIPTFPGDEVPPHKRGHHVILQRGKAWDGNVYRW